MQERYIIEYSHKGQDFYDVWNIEKSYFEASTIASVEQVIKWDRKNKDIFIFIRDTLKDKIVGEITILPISKKQFVKFMNSKLEDTEINAESLLKFEDNKKYYLLFSAIAIAPDYRNDKVILSLLLKGLNEKIVGFTKRNIEFLNMAAEGQTLAGQKFLESFLNLKCQRTTKDGYKLYSFKSIKQFAEWLERLPSYIEKYNEKL